MRVLLTANASYVPPRGGATRSNLAWLDALAARGHACRAVAAALPESPEKAAQLREEGIEAPSLGDGVECARRGPVELLSAADPARRGRLLRDEIASFQPDRVLVSSEDVGQALLRIALEAAPGRVVYLAHTPQFFPFGPESWNPDPRGRELIARCSGVVAIGRHMAAYIERHAGVRAAVVHPPVYDSGPFPRLDSFGCGFVTMINPCAVKGIGIFLALAERLPNVAFAAVPGWGTTSADRSALEALPNITLLPNCREIAGLLRSTRVLLMPSLWYEGFGLIVMQAMLHGIPVVASNSGGLEEAKAGTGFVIPVRPAERYEPVYDERGMPRMIGPPQDIEPWADALNVLLTDREAYEAEAARSREAASRFVSEVRAERFEAYLATCAPCETKAPAGEARDLLSSLSPERRALLAGRLRKRTER